MELRTKLALSSSDGPARRYFVYSRARRSAEWEAFARGEGYQRYSG